MDREVVLAAISKHGYRPLAWSAPGEYSNPPVLMRWWADREVMRVAIPLSPSCMEKASAELLADRDFIMEVGCRQLKLLPSALRADRELVLRVVTGSGAQLEHAAASLRADREVVLAAVGSNGSALQHASEALCGDPQVLAAAIRGASVCVHTRILKFASETLRADRTSVLAAVGRRGEELEDASEALRADREIVSVAVKSVDKGYGNALQYASEQLRADKPLVIEAVRRSKYQLKSASQQLRMDADVIQAAEGKMEDFEYCVSFELNFDGASRGNPGTAGAGVSIRGPAKRKDRRFVTKTWREPAAADERDEMLGLSSFLGIATNNEAEYRALLEGLRVVQQNADGMRSEIGCKAFGELWELCIRGDSELVIKQMRGEYQVTAPSLKPLHARACKYVDHLRERGVRMRFEHVPRDQNQRADRLANDGIDTLTAGAGMRFPGGYRPQHTDAQAVLGALKGCTPPGTEWAVDPSGDSSDAATAICTVPGRFRARVRACMEQQRGGTGMNWEAQMLEALSPQMRELHVIQTGGSIANYKRAPVTYDSDDPYEKLAFANGSHACYHEDESVYIPVAQGEAAPELDVTETGFETACRDMFGEFDLHIPEVAHAFDSMDYQDMMFDLHGY